MRGKRGMKKSAAVAAGIFAVVSLLLSFLGMMINLTQYAQYNIKLSAGIFLSFGLNLFVSVIWVVVLMRKQKDLFAAVCFGLLGLHRIYAVINNILSSQWLYAVSNFFFLLILAAMTVECIMELPLRRKTKSMIFASAMAAAGVLNLVATVIPFVKTALVAGDLVAGLATAGITLLAVFPATFMYAYAGSAVGGVEIRAARRDFVASQPGAAKVVGDPENYGYIGMGTHLLLTFFTFGIWAYVWVYKTTATLNKVPGNEQQSPAGQMLLCMFIPFFYYFWIYKQSKRAENYTVYAGNPTEFATLCLIFAIFIPIVTWIVLQNHINKSALAITGC